MRAMWTDETTQHARLVRYEAARRKRDQQNAFVVGMAIALGVLLIVELFT